MAGMDNNDMPCPWDHPCLDPYEPPLCCCEDLIHAIFHVLEERAGGAWVRRP